MSYPKTKDEWWKSFDDNKAALRDLVEKYHPVCRSSEWDDLPITATAAERVCEQVRESLRNLPETQDPLGRFDRADKIRDGVNLSCVLSEAWFGMPESSDVRSEPGFGVLCDLCSESYLLQPGDWDGHPE